MTTTDRAEWLSWRRTGIGASDIAGILGISPWASPFTVWADKVGLLPDEDLDDDDPREFGRRAEVMLGPWFTDKTRLSLTGEQMWLTNADNPWMLATPDALVYPPDGLIELNPSILPRNRLVADALGPLEIKTDFGKPWDEIPAHYQTQGQWQMAVGGWERMWFAVLHGRRFRTYELDRDQADIDMMTSKAGAFWVNHVLAQIPPPVDSSEATAAVIKALYPQTLKGETARLDDVRGAFMMLAEAKADRKLAEERETAASSVIRWAMKDAETGTVNGVKACTLGTQTRKTTCRHCGAIDESPPFRVLRVGKEFQ
jgi:putative phage-type endonuclease